MNLKNLSMRTRKYFVSIQMKEATNGPTQAVTHSKRKILVKSQTDGCVGKIFAVQVERTEFRSPALPYKPAVGMCAYNPRSRDRARQVYSKLD